MIAELYDMPQSHALHILKVLVHDSSLSFDIVQYCDEILICCVKSFSSESWSIRFELELRNMIMNMVPGKHNWEF